MKILEWMAWTTPTAIFFVSIALLLAAMTVWQVAQPTVERQGLLPMPTTRGDRLFIGLLGNAFLHLGYLAAGFENLWIAFGLGLVWMLLVMRFG